MLGTKHSQESTMKTGPYLFALAAVLTAASSTQAQNGPSADSSAVVAAVSDSGTTTHASVRSSIDAPPAAIQRNVSATPSAGFAFAQAHKGLGQSKAMMGVGVAGFVAGALIGGDSGKIIMVGSAVVGLYGLYQYLQ
jgi:hypothetical protein